MVLSYFSGIFLRKSYTNRVIRTLFFGRVRTGSRIPEVVESHEIRKEKYNIGCKTQVMYKYLKFLKQTERNRVGRGILAK